MLRRSHRAEHTLLLANFRFPVLGLGVRAYHIVSMLSEALISLRDWKDRHLWPFLLLGLGTAPGHCWGHCLTAQVLPYCAPPAVLWQERGSTGLLGILALGHGAVR